MTATPIPRTAALTVYGDLDVSVLDELPPGRTPVDHALGRTGRERRGVRPRCAAEVAAGRQAYVVCPLIEESENARGARRPRRRPSGSGAASCAACASALLHGRMPSRGEGRELMDAFRAGELDVLVATTVIEVGVDVPNATVMIIQDADRFGIAQLHQLRGRVGRGADAVVLPARAAKDELTERRAPAWRRSSGTTDGFELAEVDLEIRGEGQLLGTRQSGLSDLAFTKLRADRALLERAREAAGGLLDYEGPLDDEVERMFGDADVAA